jgi:hypothetical protein
MQFDFIVSCFGEIEYRVIDPGQPYDRTDIRITRQVSSVLTPDAQAHQAQRRNYITAAGWYPAGLPLTVAQAYNARAQAQWQAAMDKYGPEYVDLQPATVKGIADYVMDTPIGADEPHGHYEYRNL